MNKIDQFRRLLEETPPDEVPSCSTIEAKLESREYKYIWTSVTIFAGDAAAFRIIMESVYDHIGEFKDLDIAHGVAFHTEGQIVDAWTWVPEDQSYAQL